MQTPMSEQYFNGQMTSANLLGIKAGTCGTPGASMPVVTPTAGPGDRVTSWFHPDSSTFWVVVIGAATVLGMAGADARVRFGRARIGAQVGTA
jgi:hypothetical protein